MSMTESKINSEYRYYLLYREIGSAEVKLQGFKHLSEMICFEYDKRDIVIYDRLSSLEKDYFK